MSLPTDRLNVLAGIWTLIFEEVLRKYEYLTGQVLIKDLESKNVVGNYFAPQNLEDGKDILWRIKKLHPLGRVMQYYLQDYAHKTSIDLEEFRRRLSFDTPKKRRFKYNDRMPYQLFFIPLYKKGMIAQSTTAVIQIKKDKAYEGLLKFLGIESMQAYLDRLAYPLETQSPRLSSLNFSEVSELIQLQKQWLEKSRLPAEKEQEQLLSYYWCYLSLGFGKGIKMAKLGLFGDNRAELLTVNQDRSTDRYVGKATQSGPNLTLSLQYSRQDSDIEEVATFSFRVENYRIRKLGEVDIFWGIFSGFSRNNNPVSGRAALQRPPKHQVVTQLKELPFPSLPETPFSVKYRIANRRDEFSLSKPIRRLTDFSDADLEPIGNFTGLYEIFFLAAGGIHRNYLLIEPDLSVRAKGPGNLRFTGRINKMQLELISIALRSDENFQKYWKIIIDSKGLREGEAYSGVFIGFLEGFEIRSGRILMHKMSGQDFDAVRSSLLPLKSETYHQLNLSMDLESFFRGMKDELIYTMDSRKDLPVFHRKQAIPENLAGTYQAFYLSHDDIGPPHYKELILNYIQLYPDGRVRSFSEKSKTVYEGWAERTNAALLIFLTAESEGATVFLQFVFKIRGVDDKYLVGVFSTYTRTGFSPICGREILVKVGEEAPIETSRIPLYSEAFYQLDQNTGIPGFSKIFSGPTDNYIKGLQDRFERRDNYAELFFHSACYLAGSIKGQPSLRVQNKVIENLNQAFVHGFRDKELLEKETAPEGKLADFIDYIDMEEFAVRL